jgi:putative DNA primase/helicase
LFRDVTTNEVKAISRRPLTLGGRSLSKAKTLGPSGGCAVKLTAHEDISFGLVICESITSAIGASMMDLTPIWAVAGKGGISSFPVLAGINHLTIVADNDVSGGGQMAAEQCRDRWLAAGREVKVIVPDVAGEDMADVAARAGGR